MRRRCAGTSVRACESNNTMSSSAMRPRSGASRPAIMLTIVVLPAPDGPNRAVTPPEVSNCADSAKSPSCFSTETASILFTVEPRAGAARQPFGGNQRDQRDGDRHDDEAAGRRVAAGNLRERVDRRRDGLRLARNVGHERDGGAKLAQRLGEAKH